MSRKSEKSSNEKTPKYPIPKLHPWRLCPMGEHWVREHPRRVKPTKKYPFERTTSVAGHCRNNPSRKDQIYSDEIEEISDQRFENLKGGPCPDKLGFGADGSKYDSLIRGWTKYWNDVLKSKPRLDPDIVKALIIDQEDITNPTLNICAGVRWLFHKRKLASGKLGRQASWEEAVAEYKSYLPKYMKNPNHRGMGTFRKYYERLRKCK